MFKKLREDATQIEIELKKLQQAFHFVLNDYDYHHENNEKEIVGEKKASLDQMEEWCTNFRDHSERLAKLMEMTRQKTCFYDAQIRMLAKKQDIDISAYLEPEQKTVPANEPDEQKENEKAENVSE